VTSLAQLFDLPEPQPAPAPGPEAAPRAPRPSLEQIFRAAKDARGDFARLAAALAHIDEHLLDSPGAVDHFVRGGILVQLGQGLEALDAYRNAVQLDPGFAEAHFALGLAYADLGRDADAIAAWDQALEARPGYLDACYNKAQAHYARRELPQALETWRRALEVAPEDFSLLKKLAQTQHALGQHAEAELTREAIATAWQKSTDPTVRHTSEYVFDQFEVAGRTIHAFETLRPPKPDFFSVFSFRVVDAKGQPTGLAVQLETSSAARARGTPFVLTLVDGSAYRVMGTYDGRPDYAMLKEHVTRVLGEAVATPPRSS
jgi:tetratricopeptide (TPR) repeat protein